MNPTPLRLLHITDPHLLGDESLEIYDVNTTLSLRQVLQQALAESPVPPDAILVTGDIADDCSREAYARLRGLLQPWGVPVLCLPGNHDSPDLMSRLLNSDGFQYCGRADFRDWTIILLDSHIPREPAGRIAASEFARLQSELRATTDRPVLLCVHHLPVPVGSAWLDAVGLQNGPELRAMLDRFPQVRAVLSGHVHQTFDAIAGRVRMIATPSTCAQFTPGLPRCVMDLRPPGYRWLALASDGSIHTEVRWLQGWHTTARPTDSRASTLMD